MIIGRLYLHLISISWFENVNFDSARYPSNSINYYDSSIINMMVEI